ncbi:MAG: hypothetical protein QXE01_10420 [Sulfolobales archaeon]
MEAEKIVTSKMDTLARLGCFKPIYLLRDFISRGEHERAKNLFGSVVEDLKRFSKDLLEISQEASKYRNISRLTPTDALKAVESFLAMLKSKVFSSPNGVRLCIYIQPHLEVIYTNLSNMREDLARGLKTNSTVFLERTLKDLEAYMAYIARYTRDLLQIINEL